MQRKILVTGGAGFIGSHLVARLLDRGDFVTAFDNLSSGKIKWLEPHMAHPRFRFIEADLLDYPKILQAIQGHDVVWHFAANTDIAGGIENTELDLKHCVVATRNVLEAMRRTEAKKMLFASSQVVYGKMGSEPWKETEGPLLPLSIYAAGKLGCEAFISAFCHTHNLQAWIFRYANVVGDNMSHGVIYDFIQKLRKHPKELIILGDGRQEKNYYLVEDCLEGMMFASENTNSPCDIFNLGGEGTVTVKRIAEIVIEEMGLFDVSLRYADSWKGDQIKAVISTEKMRKLGWRPRYHAEEAVRLAARRLIQQ